MISKIMNVIPQKNIRLNKSKVNRSFSMADKRFKTEKNNVSDKSSKLFGSTEKMLNKFKSVIKSVRTFFTEEVGNKPVDTKTLTEKEKFIRETSMYDPNSPDYIHANYSVGKKSK